MDPNNATPPAPPAGSSAKALEGILEEYLVRKAPFALPTGLKEFIVKVAPYIAVLGIILALPLILLALGLSNFIYSFGSYAYRAGWYYPTLILTAATIVLEAMAIPGLFKRSLKAWRLVFYATLAQLVNSLISGGILGALVGALISLYILFQVKSYYK